MQELTTLIPLELILQLHLNGNRCACRDGHCFRLHDRDSKDCFRSLPQLVAAERCPHRDAGSERLAVAPAEVLFWAKATRCRLLPLPR